MKSWWKESEMHFGVERMRKRRIWKAGCVLAMFLAVCTVLSVRIEKMMRIEVETVQGTVRRQELTEEMLLPKTCIRAEDGAEKVFVVIRQTGATGKQELRAVEKQVVVLGEEDGKAVVFPVSLLDEEGTGYLPVIAYSTYPVQEGDQVVLYEED